MSERDPFEPNMTEKLDRCPYFDAGWCYHPDENHPSACVGIKDCMLDRTYPPKPIKETE